MSQASPGTPPRGAHHDGRPQPAQGVLRLDHRPRPRETRRVPFSFLVKGGFFLFGVPERAFASFDVTHRCNLRCHHCYFFEQGYQTELGLDAWVRRLESLRRQAGRLRRYYAFQASWVGGEPLLRPEVIDAGRRFFPYNVVVTNGSLPLPSWPDVHFFVSVDGLELEHDRIRARDGLFRRVLGHLERPELDVMITMSINRWNAHTVEEVTAFFDRTAVRHISFEFHTPVAGLAKDEELWLPLSQRDRVLDVILALKRIYGSFILPPARAYRLMKSDLCAGVTSRCTYSRVAPAFGPDGERKRPCMLGPKVDCSGCGCIACFATEAQQRRLEIARDLGQGLAGRLGAR